MDNREDRADSHLEAQRMGVVTYPGLASIQHVQQHAAAAPHIHLGAESISSGHLGGHVGLCAREGSSYTNRQTERILSVIHPSVVH